MRSIEFDMNYNLNLSEIIAVGSYDNADNIYLDNPKNFPRSEKRGVARISGQIYYFQKALTPPNYSNYNNGVYSKRNIQEMTKELERHGLRAATPEELVTFGNRNRELIADGSRVSTFGIPINSKSSIRMDGKYWDFDCVLQPVIRLCQHIADIPMFVIPVQGTRAVNVWWHRPDNDHIFDTDILAINIA